MEDKIKIEMTPTKETPERPVETSAPRAGLRVRAQVHVGHGEDASDWRNKVWLWR